MKISEEEYTEYQQLKEWAKKQKVYQSVNSITELKDDIDLPIRKSVAMVALLGCEPTFSCCGFDYEGQPFHKHHQYRQPYIRMMSNLFTTRLYMNYNLELSRYGWYFRPISNEQILELIIPMNPHWKDETCIHSSEECVFGINFLEALLYTLWNEFRDEVTIKDTNSGYKDKMRFWQYPSKSSWTVNKNDLANL